MASPNISCYLAYAKCTLNLFIINFKVFSYFKKKKTAFKLSVEKGANILVL